MAAPPVQDRRKLDPWSPRVTESLLLGMAAGAFFSIALMQILMAAAYVHFGLSRWRRGGPPLRLPLWLPIAGFLGVSLISAVHAQKLECVRDTLSSALAAGVYLIVCNVFTTSASARRAAWCLAAIGTAVSTLGLVQAFSAGEELRIAGLLGHYYTYAGVVSLAWSASLAWAVLGARGVGRALFALALLVMLAALLQTQTRSAVLAVAVGAGVVVLAWKPRLVWAMPVVLALGYFLSPGHIQDRMRTMGDPEDDTVVERYEMWSNGLAIWRDHFWLGVGPEEVRDYYDDYRDKESRLAHITFPGRIHNSAIQLAAERGVFGVALWLIFWLAWSVRALRHLHRARGGPPEVRAMICGSLAALAAFQVMGVFECNVSDSEVSTLSYFLLGLPLGLEALSARREAGDGSVAGT